MSGDDSIPIYHPQGYSALIMVCPRCHEMHYSDPIPEGLPYVKLDRALESFAALLAVARAVTEDGCCAQLSCEGGHPAQEAVEALDRQFPGWREWKP